MLNEELAQLAIRTRAATLVVATTGSATLSATSTGYARSTGSFVTDGFLVGQEVAPTGFTQTTPGIITAVAALALSIEGGRAVQSAGAARSLVAGLPTLRAWENEQLTVPNGRWYVTDEWVPGAPPVIKTWPTRTGRFQEDPLSIWTFYGLTGTGISAIRAAVFAFKKLFAAGTHVSLSDGTSIDVRGDTSIRSGQIIRIDGGWSYCQVTIPFRASTRNAIAA